LHGTFHQHLDDRFEVPWLGGHFVPGAECQDGRCNLPVVGQTGHRPQAIRAAAIWQLTAIDKEC